MEQKVAEALRMLEAFASVGVTRFSVTQTNIRQQKVEPYWPGVNVAGMRLLLADAVPRAWERCQNLILRPHPFAGGALAQLDDLSARVLDRIAYRAFLTLETSPGNYQAWVAIDDGDEALARRLVKGMQCDWNASRAARIAGSPNCKEKYAPHFHRVCLFAAYFGRRVRPADLEGDLAPVALPVVPAPKSALVRTVGRRVWPSYPMCLERARKSSSGGKQRGMVDFTWCCTAADWGWSVDEIARMLMEVSTKAKENGWEYALKTAEAAALRVMKNGSWRKK